MVNMEEAELVSGEGWVSDDSSFYGDSDEQERLLSRCEDFTSSKFWEHHGKDLNSILTRTRAMPPPDLHNIYQGKPDAWQLSEPVTDFLHRLPPLTTTKSTFPWIWAANPYPEGRDRTARAHARDLLGLHGPELLQQSLEERAKIQKGKRGTITKSLNEEAEALKNRIAILAEATNVLSGKWMLFPKVDQVTQVWKMIVEGTVNNRLGSAAKVATDQGNDAARLICIYTKDFRDTQDVLRVLKELVAMGLVKPGRGIYYKADVYTYLEIYADNASQYGLQATVYTSQKMLAS